MGTHGKTKMVHIIVGVSVYQCVVIVSENQFFFAMQAKFCSIFRFSEIEKQRLICLGAKLRQKQQLQAT